MEHRKQPISEQLRVEPTPDPWGSPETVITEIISKKKPVDYSTIIGDSRVLFWGESHSNFPVREHIARYAEQLKANGITHYGIEASELISVLIDRLNEGEKVDLSSVDLGPSARSNYALAVQAMANQGIKIIPLDVDQTTETDKLKRELHIATQIKKVLEQDKSAKIAVLIGAFHTTKKMPYDGIPYVGRMLIEEGISTVTVMMTGGTDCMPSILLDPVRQAGLANQEFILEMSEYNQSNMVPFGAGEADIILHLPEKDNQRPMLFQSMRRLFD